jgi:cobalt/nickel transport protein
VSRRRATFPLAFGLLALVTAGGLSYLADSSPDGLDSVTSRGCQVTESERGKRLSGECVARSARDHPLANGPFADYAVGGDSRFTGVAGVVGVVATFGVAGGLFRLIRRRNRSDP